MTNDEPEPKPEGQNAPADFERFWADADEISVVREGETPSFDLEERTARFAEAVVDFAKTIPHSPVNNRLIDQGGWRQNECGSELLRGGRCGFEEGIHLNINRCRKEVRETKFFLRIITRAEPGLKPGAHLLWQEAKELNLIFFSIVRKGRK